MLKWAFTQKERILFLPDQHLGRNTAYDLGIPLQQMAVWDPETEKLTYEGKIEDTKVILWKGHCSVHEKFTMENVRHIRESGPGNENHRSPGMHLRRRTGSRCIRLHEPDHSHAGKMLLPEANGRWGRK